VYWVYWRVIFFHYFPISYSIGTQQKKNFKDRSTCTFWTFLGKNWLCGPRPKLPLTTVLILYANLLTAESFYYVKYGSSIITSKVLQKTLSNEDIKTVCFGISIHVLSWRQQRHKCLCFHYWDFLTNFWRNNWRSIFDVVERLCYRFEMVFRYRECVSTGAAGACTHRSLGHHLLHPLILRLLVLCAPADFEAQNSLLQKRQHPQIQIPNACPDWYDPKAFIYIKSYAKTLIIGRLNLLKLTPLQNRWWCSITYRLQTYFLWV
jgi:hypothetical protein